jgi:hypothetical protein
MKGGMNRMRQDVTPAVARLTPRLIPIFLIAFAATAAPSQKSPWQWKPEERAALRLNTEARRVRLTEYRAKLSSRGEGASSFRCDDVIDGTVHPELLFPTQLFRDLVASAFVRLPAAAPSIARAYSSDLFRAPHEWTEFIELARPYGELLKRQEALLTLRHSPVHADAARAEAELSDLHARQAAAAATALTACRKAFGAARFDRALYEVIGRSTVECFSDVNGDRGAAATRALVEQDKRSESQ